MRATTAVAAARIRHATVDASILTRVVTRWTEIPDEARCDLLPATIVGKYCPSNAACVA